MRAKVAWGLVWGSIPLMFVSLCARPVVAGNCALYVRAQTGVDLYGAAGGWWDEAGARYWRGHIPQLGSILVFKRTSAIPAGHVAVVARVLGPREIMVDQANWYHGMVTPNVAVIDESPDNDWTTVAVMNVGSGNFGRDYPSYGFVYPQTGPRELVADASSDSANPYIAATPTAYDPYSRLGAVSALIIANDDHRRRNPRQRPARRPHRGKASGHVPHLAAAAHTYRRGTAHAHGVHTAMPAPRFAAFVEPSR